MIHVCLFRYCLLSRASCVNWPQFVDPLLSRLLCDYCELIFLRTVYSSLIDDERAAIWAKLKSSQRFRLINIKIKIICVKLISSMWREWSGVSSFL